MPEWSAWVRQSWEVCDLTTSGEDIRITSLCPHQLPTVGSFGEASDRGMLSLSLSHTNTHTHTHTHARALSLYLSHARSLSLYLTCSLSLSRTRSLYLTRALSLAHSLCLSLSPSLSLSLSHALTRSLSLAHSLARCRLKGTHPLTLRAGLNCPFQSLELYWRSPISGCVRCKSREWKK